MWLALCRHMGVAAPPDSWWLLWGKDCLALCDAAPGGAVGFCCCECVEPWLAEAGAG
jgi:hypothetical protein